MKEGVKICLGHVPTPFREHKPTTTWTNTENDLRNNEYVNFLTTDCSRSQVVLSG